ncbi:hypothetical protein [Bradyrhizobium sp. Ash2021]|uniref:hypothetical protein n=1 Tax=Bradyrhizobium sp. Ash2021 TaxID=2954771 RepID=UPI0035C08461
MLAARLPSISPPPSGTIRLEAARGRRTQPKARDGAPTGVSGDHPRIARRESPIG